MIHGSIEAIPHGCELFSFSSNMIWNIYVFVWPNILDIYILLHADPEQTLSSKSITVDLLVNKNKGTKNLANYKVAFSSSQTAKPFRMSMGVTKLFYKIILVGTMKKEWQWQFIGPYVPNALFCTPWKHSHIICAYRYISSQEYKMETKWRQLILSSMKNKSFWTKWWC